jgi:hypothetical protein
VNNITTRILIYSKSGYELKPIKIYYDSDGRKWVEAHNGTKFVIEVKNNTADTYLAVVSVDGLNVINAKRAELDPDNGGYVVDKFQSLKVEGWRTSMDSVREFVFTNDSKKSYSHKLGANESNTGVIGIALFKEYIMNYFGSTTLFNLSKTYPNDVYYGSGISTGSSCTTTTDSSNINTTALRSNTSNQASYSTDNIEPLSCSISTAQGDSKVGKAISSYKKFLSTVEFSDSIYYDSRENLIKRGIIKVDKDKKSSLPQPFSTSSFCPSL